MTAVIPISAPASSLDAERVKKLSQAQAAWLDASQGLREGRAFVREELARDFHAAGMTRAADAEYQRAKDIRSGKA